MVHPERNWPVRYLRKFLSCRIFIPIATLSYSMYLYHILIIKIVYKYFFTIEDFSNGCPWSTGEAWKYIILFVISSYFASMLVSFVTYSLVEKPAMEARKAW